MNKNASIYAFSRNVNFYHKFRKFSHTWRNIKIWDKIQQVFWREIKPQGIYRNMKEFILETNLEGQVVIKIVYHFVDSNLGVEIYAWEGGKWFTFGNEGFSWRIRGREELYRFAVKWTLSQIVVKNFPCTLKVPSPDCFKSIASHKICIFLKN